MSPGRRLHQLHNLLMETDGVKAKGFGLQAKKLEDKQMQCVKHPLPAVSHLFPAGRASPKKSVGPSPHYLPSICKGTH